MSNVNVDLLLELLEIAIDSKSFYVAAAAAVTDPVLNTEFRRMADAKGELIDKLTCQFGALARKPDAVDTIAGSLRSAYAQVLAVLGTRGAAPYNYTTPLEESEGRLLKRFNEALAATDSDAIRATLLAQLPKMRAGHDDMKLLKTSLAA